MPKNVQFYLGPALGLSQRSLVISRMPGAGDDNLPIPPLSESLFASNETTASVSLPDNLMLQAVLTDHKTTGEKSNPKVLNFNTGSLQFPGPAMDPRESLFRIMSMEDESSSSSSSSSSNSSSSNSSSSSSSHSRSSSSSASSNSSSSSHSRSSSSSASSASSNSSSSSSSNSSSSSSSSSSVS